MASNPLLYITDGTTIINLLDTKSGFLLKEWTPVIANPKEGGIFVDSPLSSGRRLVMRNNENAIETFEIALRSSSQDSTISMMRSMRTLLTKAHEYWTTDWQGEPVYIVAKGPCETETRYAIIKGWRLQTDDNPYAMPFSGRKSAMVDLTLILERGDWTSEAPGVGGCVEVSALKEANSDYLYEAAYPAASGDDAYVTHSTSSIQLATAKIYYGSSGNLDCAIVFDDIDVPQGSTIRHAYIDLFTGSTTARTATVAIELADNASVFSTYADYVGRDYSAAEDNGTFTPSNPGWVQRTSDLANLVQDVVDRVGWASGQRMAFRFTPISTYSDTVQINAFDAGVYLPELKIYYSTPNSTYGQEATCADSVFIANKENTAQITHVFIWDESGAAFDATNYALESAYSMFPAVPAAGDYIIFGSTEGPFTSLIFDIGTAQTDLEITWAYYSSTLAGWDTVDPHDETEITEPFQNTGVCSWVSKQENDWEAVALNGVTAYWLRAIVTAVGASPAPPAQQNRYVYTVTNSYVDIAADQVDGDIPAIARIYLKARGNDATAVDATTMWCSRVHAGLRTLSRGVDFSPWLNAADVQHQLGVTCSATAGSFEDDAYGGGPSYYGAAPTKKFHVYANIAAVTTFTNTIRWTIDSAYAGQYRGTYNVYIRYAQDDGDDRKYTVRLAYTQGAAGGGVQSITNPVALNIEAVNYKSKRVASLGTINLLSGSYDSDSVGDIVLDLQAKALDAGELVVYDLILMPSDEWFGVYTSQSGGDDGVKDGFVLDIDGGIAYPKIATRAFLRYTDEDAQIYSRYSIIQNGPPILQTGVAQRLWFLSDQFEQGQNYAMSVTGTTMSVRVDAQYRYLSMRGVD